MEVDASVLVVLFQVQRIVVCFLLYHERNLRPNRALIIETNEDWVVTGAYEHLLQ
jgi:hypothetical protein